MLKMLNENIYSKFNYNIEEIHEQLDSEGENYDRQEIADELYSLMRALYYNYQNEHHKMIVYRALHSELSCSEFVNMVKKSQNLGEFWTSDIESAKYFGGDWLIDSRGEGNIYIIKGECSVFDININETVVNNLLYPEENEVNINGRKVKLLDIFEYFPDTGDGHSIMSSTIISRNTLLLNKKNKKKYKLIDRLDYGFLVFEDPETKTIFLNHEKDVNDFSDKYAIHKIDDDRIKYNLKNINKYCNNETKCHYVLNEFANTVLTHIQGEEQKYIDMMADIKPSDMDNIILAWADRETQYKPIKRIYNEFTDKHRYDDIFGSKMKQRIYLPNIIKQKMRIIDNHTIKEAIIMLNHFISSYNAISSDKFYKIEKEKRPSYYITIDSLGFFGHIEEKDINRFMIGKLERHKYGTGPVGPTYDISIGSFINEYKKKIAEAKKNNKTIPQLFPSCQPPNGYETYDEIENKIKEFTKLFNDRGSYKTLNGEFIICISRFPYDVISMSTDQRWTSCQDHYNEDLNKTVNEFINSEKNGIMYIGSYDNDDLNIYNLQDIKEGTLVAYLIDKNDKSMRKIPPYARIAIKPYYFDDGVIDKDIFMLIPDSPGDRYSDDSLQPNVYNEFYNTVYKWCNDINITRPDGIYIKPENLYDDNEIESIIKKGNKIKEND